MRRTNRDISDRSISKNYTREIADAYDIEFDDLDAAIREQARAVENSINGIVAVASAEDVINVRCIYGREADGDMVRRLVENILSAAMKELREADA